MKDLFTKAHKTCFACERGLTGRKVKCYPCRNNLTGTVKYNPLEYQEWECRCKEYICQCKEVGWFHCPLCTNNFPESEYLGNAISDVKARWIGNMICHYRHDHITSWDKMWNKDFGYHYKEAAKFYEVDYEQRKMETNERAKRQIIRKCTEYLIEHSIGKEHFLMLKNNDDQKTLALIDKILSKIY